MPRLGDIRKLFWRRKSNAAPAIDLSLTQARGLDESFDLHDDAAETIPFQPGAGERAALLESDERPLTASSPMRVEPKPQVSPREMIDMMTLVRMMNEHLDRQSQRTDELLTALQRLPQSLDTLPEINRQSSRLMEILAGHLGGTKSRDEALASAMTRLTETGSHLTDVLGLLQQQLDRNGELASSIAHDLNTMRTTLGSIATSNQRTADVLTEMRDAAAERESRLTRALLRNQYWTIGALMFGALTALSALVVAVVALKNS